MNERVKKLWVEALTSGEYEQTKGQLRRKDKFCCLGVLEDLHKREIGTKWRSDDRQRLVPPRDTCEWAGLTDPDPRPDGVETLTALNDSGKSFPEIAKLIAENL